MKILFIINLDYIKRCGGVIPVPQMANMLDCNIEINEFEPQLHYCIHFQINTFGKGMNLLIPPAMGSVVLLLFFYKDGFDIK